MAGGPGGSVDEEASYDAMLHRGLRLAGETKDFFVDGRLAVLERLMPPGFHPSLILDFGCGHGYTAPRLAARFAGARVVGVDASNPAVETARHRYSTDRVSFLPSEALPQSEPFDLCYSNGVLHHIDPRDRANVLDRIRSALRPGGIFAAFENNPWNPGTRLVMRRIPFDRDARPVNARHMTRLLRSAGFEVLVPARYLFVFPAALARLRVVERHLERLPVGGQYLVLARRRD